MFNILKKATQSTTTSLPPIVEPKIKSTEVVLLDNFVKNESFGLDDESVEVLEPEEHADFTKPLYHDYWIRSMDTQKLIYFYNVRTGESSWLGPCGICCKESHKYCVDCGKAYCDTHFKKRHEKKSRQKHKWQHADPPNPDKLNPKTAAVHCIECSLKEATLMCTDCWDGYCETCFHLVHHCGDLIYHQGKPYLEAKKGWSVVPGTAKEPEYYVHGETEKTTFEKPYELMSPLERRFFRQFKKVEAKVAELVEEVEQVQFEVEGTKYDRDRTFYDAQVSIHELHAKHAELFKEQTGNKLDHSKLKQPTGLFGTLFGQTVKEQVYISKLLHPTDRSRGEVRTAYIKQVLEASTAGLVKAEDEAKSKKKHKKKS